MEPGPQPVVSRKIGIVTGLASEANVASAMMAEAAVEGRVVCAGAVTEKAAGLARELIAEGCEALLSFGVAGALAPDLDGGDLIVVHGLRGPEGGDYPTDAAWRTKLTEKLDEIALNYREGAILGSARPLRGAAAKASAFAQSGCLAVDMESAAVAAVAAEAQRPFLAVRAIADRARDSLPAFVETAVKPDGQPAVGRVLAALARRPWDIAATLGLARRTELALARLRMLESAKEVLFGRF